jgi:hypothetical protein
LNMLLLRLLLRTWHSWCCELSNVST